VTREAHTPSSLIAIARTRRIQRAIAHAYLHRDAPIPTLRTSLGFMTSTACTTQEELAEHGHRMTIAGAAVSEGVAYVIEDLGEGEPPIAYRLHLRGPRAGHLVPVHAWYEPGGAPDELRARIAAVASTLEPVQRTTTEAWMLSTRIVQRRALRVPGHTPPIRKFALQLRVEPVGAPGACGHTTVTAFLRPQAVLADVWSLPGDPGLAIARVSYTGIPSGLGLAKDTVVLLSE
jgi:hypothetical protein